MDNEERVRQYYLAKALLQQAFGCERIRSDFSLVDSVQYVLDHLGELAAPNWGLGNFH